MVWGGSSGVLAVKLPGLCAPCASVALTPGVKLDGLGTVSVSNQIPVIGQLDGSDREPFQ